MTWNDLIQQDPYKLPYSGGATWGTPAYQNQQNFLSSQAPYDRVAMIRNLQADKMIRDLQARGNADSAQRKLMFLQQFAGRPVNLYGAPQDQAQAQLQDLVQKDYNARQQGVNNMWAFQEQTKAEQERQLKLQAQREAIANQQLARKSGNYALAEKIAGRAQADEQKALQLQGAKQALESGNRQLANAAFEQALGLVKGGSDISTAMINGLTPDQVDMLKNYKDAQDRIIQRQQDALNNKLNPPPTPNEVRLSNEALQQYGGMKNRADIVGQKNAQYSQALAAQPDLQFGWLHSIANVLNPFSPTSQYNKFVQPENTATAVSQFSPQAIPGYGEKYVAQSLAADPIAKNLIHQGPNGLESLLAQGGQVQPAQPAGGGFGAGGFGDAPAAGYQAPASLGLQNAPMSPLTADQRMNSGGSIPAQALLARSMALDAQSRPITQEAYNSLPPGASYIAPDGSMRFKPMAVPAPSESSLDYSMPGQSPSFFPSRSIFNNPGYRQAPEPSPFLQSLRQGLNLNP